GQREGSEQVEGAIHAARLARPAGAVRSGASNAHQGDSARVADSVSDPEMEPTLRHIFNAAYDESFYQRYLDRLEARVGCKIPFRVAETPLFVPLPLRDRLARAA